MSLLIAVKSCNKHRLAGYNDAIRKTWGHHAANLFFFHGLPTDENSQLQIDELFVAAPDNYDGLPQKTKAILDFFLGTNDGHIFLCDTDTFVVPSRLEKCGYEQYDVSGRYGNTWPIGKTKTITDDRGQRHPNVHPWPSGGVGYFLSRKAAELVLSSEIEHWAEDYMVGQATGPAIQRGELKAADLPNFECYVAWHFQRRQYQNQVYDLKFNWQQKMYAEHK